MLMQVVQKGGSERITEQVIVKMPDRAPNSIVTGAALGEQDMDVWIPLQASAKCMKDANKPGG